ncbi:MAG: ABC transporter permease, partial [Pyrinomonadaceae bacterium]|nr:ABC transporter permease [Pyrinomonadaceae bacterium]
MMTTLLQDIRYGARTLLKSPGFTVVAVLALALGIGANTAIFSVVNAVLLKSLPFENPERIMRFYNARTNEPSSMSFPDFHDYANRAQTLEHVAAYLVTGSVLRGGDEPERLRGAAVSARMFPLLGAHAALGRVFTTEEDVVDGPELIVLSHELWQRRFGGDPKIIGQQINLSGNSTVIGVMPPGFKFPVGTTYTMEYWEPLAPQPSVKQSVTQRGTVFLNVVARLKPDVTVQGANAELETIASALAAQYPDTNTNRSVRLVSMHESLVSGIKPALLVLLGAVGFVLLIACANVANLLLARAAARGREIAVRTALGAGRARIVRQLLTESLLLAFVGGIAGLLLAVWGVDLLIAMSPADMPLLKNVSLDARVLGFTLLVSTLTGILFGLVPALQATKLDLNESLKEGGRASTEGKRRNRIRGALVVTEVALSLVLLVGAGLLIKSFYSLLTTDPGYATDRVLTMTLPLSSGRYPKPEDQARFFQQLLQRTSELSGVEAAGLTTQLPLGGNESIFSFNVEGRPPAAPGSTPVAGEQFVTPDYFRAMNISLRKGRLFTEGDKMDSLPIVVINETFARRQFPNEDPIGKRIILDSESGTSPPPIEIVGVVSDIRHQDLSAEAYADAYFPFMQSPSSRAELVVRTSAANPNDVTPALRNL